MLLKQRLVLFSRFSTDAAVIDIITPNHQSLFRWPAPAFLAIALMCVVPGCTAGKKQAAKRPIIADRSVHSDETPAADRAEDIVETINPNQSDSPVKLVNLESFLQADDDTIAPETDSTEPPSDVESDNPEIVWTLQELQNLALQNNPAIKQASAAASEADGVHNQTGLRPNPRIGYFANDIRHR